MLDTDVCKQPVKEHAHVDPILDTREFVAEFENGEVHGVTTNRIAQSMIAMCDESGNNGPSSYGGYGQPVALCDFCIPCPWNRKVLNALGDGVNEKFPGWQALAVDKRIWRRRYAYHSHH